MDGYMDSEVEMDCIADHPNCLYNWIIVGFCVLLGGGAVIICIGGSVYYCLCTGKTNDSAIDEFPDESEDSKNGNKNTTFIRTEEL